MGSEENPGSDGAPGPTVGDTPPTDTELLDRIAALTQAVKDQQEVILGLVKSHNDSVQRVNEHHDFLAQLQARMSDRAKADAGQPGAPANPAGLPAGYPTGQPTAPATQGFTDPNAAKAADAMKMFQTGLNLLDGGGTPAAGVMDSYGAKLAELQLAKLANDNSLTDVLRRAFEKGLEQQATAVVKRGLPSMFE